MKPARAGLVWVLIGLGACARDPAQVRWDEAFEQAERLDAPARATRMAALAETAPRHPDEGAARFEEGIALEDVDVVLAARHWREVSRSAPRRADRARAHYQLGRLAEAHAQWAAAEAIDHALVRYYPELMPGERGLAHIVRRARAVPGPLTDRAMDEVLAWLHRWPAVDDSALGDNALYLAAEEAERRYHRDGHPEQEATAERLYLEVAARYPSSALWNDALWNLSYLYHERAAYRDEIAAIERIYRARTAVSLFGQNEHEYFWKGQLRIARVQLVDQHLPRLAAASFLKYRVMFPKTIKHDDMLFFAGCALRLAGDSPDALWDELRRDFPESRYMRRLPNPTDAQCVPPEVE